MGRSHQPVSSVVPGPHPEPTRRSQASTIAADARDSAAPPPTLARVASAFISYSHEDHEFVLALVQALQRQGLEIRYDQVALHIGDSLILAISQEIADGDFLIAV